MKPTLEIRSPAEVEQRPNLRVLIYGQPGVGKTTLALSAPNPLIIDVDQGQYRVNRQHRSHSLLPRSWEDLLQIVDFRNKEALKPFDTIIVDTIGKMMSLMDASIMRNNPKMSYMGNLSQQGYGLRKTLFKKFLDQLDGLGKHLIFVAHEKEEKQGDALVKRPEVGGSSGQDLMKELDLVGYYQAMGDKSTISFSPADQFYGKNTCDLPKQMIIEKPVTKEDNRFFINVFETVAEQGRQDKLLEGDYNELVIELAEQVSKIQTADDANKFTEHMGTVKHIWDSLDQAKKMFKKRCLEQLKLKYDRAEKKYLPPAGAQNTRGRSNGNVQDTRKMAG